MEQNSLHIIKKKLHKFLRKYFLNELYKGIALFIFFSFLYLSIIGIIEFFFWLSPSYKKVFFFSSWLVLFIFFIAFLWNPIANLIGLKKSLSNEKAARSIGKYFPEISDKLLNLLQLQNNKRTSELLLASIEQKATELKKFDFTKAVDFKQNKAYFSLLLIPFFFLLFIQIAGKDRFVTDPYKRLISYNKYFQPPAPFSLKLISPSQLIAGEDYPLKIQVTGEKWPTEILFSIDDTHFLPLHKENDSIFSIRISRPSSDLSFFLHSGIYKFGPYRVSVHHPSVISDVKINLQFPSYLHLKEKKTSQLTNLSLPEGTRLTWNFSSQYTDSIIFKLDTIFRLLPVNKGDSKFSHQAFSSFSYYFTPVSSQKQQNTLQYKIEIIPDKKPQLFVAEHIDSLRFINYYKIQATDDHLVTRLEIFYKKLSDSRFNKRNLPIPKSDYINTFFRFPTDIFKDSIAESYIFYFRVYDNYPFQKTHFAQSSNFFYNYLSQDKKQEQLLSSQKKLLKQLQTQKFHFNQDKQNLQKLNYKLANHQKLDWQTKQLLDHTLQQEQQQEQFFNETLQKFRKLLSQSKKSKSDERKALEQRLKELEKLQHKKKLLDELQKLAEKLDKDKLLQKIKELKNYSEHQEKSLERMLEITKKYYIRQKLNALSQKMMNLSKQEKSLAKSSKDKTENQDSITKKLSRLKNDFDSLSNTNKSLKRPLKLPNSDTDIKEIQQDLKEAEKHLQQNNANQANSKQNRAANKMKSLSKKMQMAMGGGSSQHSEDIATLQALLKSLINFSFTQETLLKQYQTQDLRAHLANHLIEQNTQKTYFKTINDSLYTLALRNPKISQKLLDLSYNIHTELELTLQSLSDLNSYSGAQHAQFVLTYANTLADMISRALDEEKNASASQGSGQGKKKGKGFSLPDIIKKQGQSIKQMEQQLAKKNASSSKPKKNASSSSEKMSGEQYKLYQQQQEVKEALSQLQDKFSQGLPKQKLSKILKQLDALNKRLIKEGVTKRNLQTLKNLQQDLLKLKNASFQQNRDNNRISHTNTNNYTPPDSLFIKKFSKFAPSLEQLKRYQLPVNQKIKLKIKEFITHD